MPEIPFDIISPSSSQYRTRNARNIPIINSKHQILKNSYFPSTITEWNKLDFCILNSETLNIFKSKILQFMRPTASSIFGCHNPIGVKLLTRPRLGLSHFREFSNTVFKIHSTRFPVEEKKLKLLLVFSFHVPITLTKDRPSKQN